MNSPRLFATTLGSWLLAAIVALVAAGRVWGHTAVRSAAGARVQAQVTGHDVAAALAPCAGALLALAVFVLASRGWLRRLTGVLGAALGVGIVVAALVGHNDIGAALADKAFGVQRGSLHSPASVWPWVAAFAGVVAAACGLLTAAVGPRWSGLGRRYDAPGTPQAPADDDASRWAALDRGEDPTA
jgi:uncharacterized membrane protein (TIGR02234 family)